MSTPNCVAGVEEIWAAIAESHIKRKIEKKAYMVIFKKLIFINTNIKLFLCNY